MPEDRAPESVWTRSAWRRSARRLWKSAYGQGKQDERGEPLGLWVTDACVVLARFDRLEAWDVATGAPRWTWQPPGEDVVRVVSADVEDGVGVVLHHDDGAHTASRTGLTALDPASGTVVWHREEEAERLGYPGGHGDDEVALGAGRLATAVTDWKSPPKPRADDVRTGRTLWQHTLDDGRHKIGSVVGALPFTAHLRPRGSRGRPRLLVAGTTLELPSDCKKFGRSVAVLGDVVAARLIPADERENDNCVQLGAYSAASGELLWRWRVKSGSSTLVPLAHRGWLLALHGYGDRLSVLDPTDGRVVAARKLPGYAFDPLVAAHGDVVAVASRGSSGGVRTFRWR